MSILVYAPRSDGLSLRLLGAVAAVAGPEEVETLASPAELLARLRRPGRAPLALVLRVTGEADLSALVESRELFYRLPTIIMLPDLTLATTARAFLLRPRLVVPAHGEVATLGAVLARMVDQAAALTRSQGQSIPVEVEAKSKTGKRRSVHVGE